MGLYSPDCREGSFSETGLPINSILGNPERIKRGPDLLRPALSGPLYVAGHSLLLWVNSRLVDGKENLEQYKQRLLERYQSPPYFLREAPLPSVLQTGGASGHS